MLLLSVYKHGLRYAMPVSIFGAALYTRDLADKTTVSMAHVSNLAICQYLAVGACAGATWPVSFPAIAASLVADTYGAPPPGLAPAGKIH